MKKLIVGLMCLAFVLVANISQSATTEKMWRWNFTSNCSALANRTSQDICLQTPNNILYVCVPNSGSNGICSSAAEWKTPSGFWLDNGLTISLLSPRSVSFGSGQLRGDSTVGLVLNPSGDGVTTLTFLPTGLLTTPAGILYTGNDAFANLNRTTDKSSPGVGDFWFNTTQLLFKYYNGIAVKRIPTTQFYFDTFASPVASNRFIMRPPSGIKIESIWCITNAGTVPITIQQCSSTGTGCTGVHNVITCTSTGVSDQAGIFTPNITAGNFVNLNFGTPTGSPASVHLTVSFTQNDS